MSKICKYCQNVLENSERFCPKCGHQEFEKYSDKKIKTEQIIDDEVSSENIEIVESNSIKEETKVEDAASIENKIVQNIKVKNYEEKSKRLGIISLILSIFLSIVALIPAFIGMVYSLKAKRNNQKYKVGLTSSVFAIVISIVTAGLLYFVYENYINKDNQPTEKVNYKAILKEYGKGFETKIADYLKENMVLPTFEEIEKKYEFPEHKVICEEKNINEDGTIFLNECTIDDEKINFSYGKYIEVEETNSNIIYFYHIIAPEYDYYTSSKMEQSLYQSTYDYVNNIELVSSYTCSSASCKGDQYLDKFIVIDNETVYMSSIGNSQNTFKKWNASKEYLMDIENTRYIISLYESSGKTFMYTINNQDEIDILYSYEGQDSYIYYDENDDTSVVLSFDNITLNNGLILVKNEINYILKSAYIYNFKTKKNVLDIPVNNKNYISLTSDENYYYLNYDCSVKRIFNHRLEEILGENYFLSNDLTSILKGGSIITADFKYNEETKLDEYQNTYSKYNKSGEKQFTSEVFKRILSIHEMYALVVDEGSKIKLLNIENNNIVAEFGNWESTYSFKFISYTNYDTGESDALYFAIEDSSLHSSNSKNAGYIYTYKYSNGEYKKFKTELDNY